MKKSLMIFFAIVCLFCLSACGKSARPIPYEGSGYPHTYPYN